MATREDRYRDNVPGRFYVDESCIFCNMCDDIAPNVFRASDDGDHNHVYQQPNNEDDLALAEEALESCPTNSIGNDG